MVGYERQHQLRDVGQAILVRVVRVMCLLVLWAPSSEGGSLRATDKERELQGRGPGRGPSGFVRDITGVIETETIPDPNAARTPISEMDPSEIAKLLKPRVVGGSKVARGKYPYFCRVDKNYYPHCGGTLVAPDVVLSAAHCRTFDMNELSVLVNGYHDNRYINPDQRLREVVEMRIHPNYTTSTYYNDLMLLKLNESVSSREIPYVELNRDSNLPGLDENVTVMGLGALYESGGYPDLLQSVEVDMIDNEFCTGAYEGVGLFPIPDDIMICAGKRTGAPKDACQGDSGGPLLDKNEVQVGVISFGLGCARQQFPGVYARTAVRGGKEDWLGETVCAMTDSNELDDWCATPVTQVSSQLATIPPTASPTAAPTSTPTSMPTSSPTARPSNSPTTSPTALPTSSPTGSPTASPTAAPTAAPTAIATESPTARPTSSPTVSPTAAPTDSPTARPSTLPSEPPTALPTSGPTETPTETPTGAPTAKPTDSPTESPTAAPTAMPTASPTSRPTNSPTEAPTALPTLGPTDSPTAMPTGSPTARPSNSPTVSPTAAPSGAPTARPTDLPTAKPSNSPTVSPTAVPTDSSTSKPSNSPTEAPTASPSASPSKFPTAFPTSDPTQSPTGLPTGGPTVFTILTVPTEPETPVPTANPSSSPSKLPTALPTLVPTQSPTGVPTEKPKTPEPTASPSASPSKLLTALPTLVPTQSPTGVPTAGPSSSPTEAPTALSTALPTGLPTAMPTLNPSQSPTGGPTAKPSSAPTEPPTDFPTGVPSGIPTGGPTAKPSNTPSESPTDAPTLSPTTLPTGGPTAKPSRIPSESPTAPPTGVPTAMPTSDPTRSPTGAPTAILTENPTVKPSKAPTDLPTSTPVASGSLRTGQTIVSSENEAVSGSDGDAKDLSQCEDEPGGTFMYFFKRKSCDWLGSLGESTIDSYCMAGSDAWRECQATCSQCNGTTSPAESSNSFGISEVLLVNADTDEVIQGAFDCSPDICVGSAKNFNILANTAGNVGSVRFIINGPIKHRKIENNPPYTLWSDDSGGFLGSLLSDWSDKLGDLFRLPLPKGDYTLVAQAFSEKDGEGKASKPFIISFSVPTVPETTLDASEGSDSHSATCMDDPEGSFRVSYSSRPKDCGDLRRFSQTSRDEYCTEGSGGAWDICRATCGRCTNECVDHDGVAFMVYSRNARPTERDCSWVRGNPDERENACDIGGEAYGVCRKTCGACQLVEQESPSTEMTAPVASTVGIEGFTLVDADTEQDIEGAFDCTPDICKGSATSFNIHVNTFGEVENVRLSLDGPIKHTELQNKAPWALWSDDTNGASHGSPLPPGRYSLTAQAIGKNGAEASSSISFSVAEETLSEQESSLKDLSNTISPDVPCIDLPGATFKENGKRDRECSWLRESRGRDIEKHCTAGSEAWEKCRATCGRCNECIDHDNIHFEYKGDDRTCSWLRNERRSSVKSACKENEQAYGVCRKTCDAC